MNILVNEEDQDSGEINTIDVFSRLANDRILMLGDLDDSEVSEMVAVLLLRDLENSIDKISLFINSEVISVRAAFTFLDMMSLCEAPIETIVQGHCFGGEATAILASGTKGMRYATPNAVIAPCQIIDDKMFQSDIHDAKSILTRLQQDNKSLMGIIAKATGKKVKDVMKDFEKQEYMSAKDALKYGLIDKVIGS